MGQSTYTSTKPGMRRPQFVPHRAIRRDDRRYHDYAVARQHSRHESDAAHMRVAILLAEAEASRESLAQHIAIEQFVGHAVPASRPASTREMVVFPAPERPVSQTTQPCPAAPPARRS